MGPAGPGHGHGDGGAAGGGNTARQGAVEHRAQEVAADPFTAGFQGQHKAGEADHQGGDQRQLDGLERINRGQHQDQQAQQEAEDGLGQEQGSGPGNVVDDPSAFQHHVGQDAEV